MYGISKLFLFCTEVSVGFSYQSKPAPFPSATINVYYHQYNYISIASDKRRYTSSQSCSSLVNSTIIQKKSIGRNRMYFNKVDNVWPIK